MTFIYVQKICFDECQLEIFYKWWWKNGRNTLSEKIIVPYLEFDKIRVCKTRFPCCSSIWCVIFYSSFTLIGILFDFFSYSFIEWRYTSRQNAMVYIGAFSLFTWNRIYIFNFERIHIIIQDGYVLKEIFIWCILKSCVFVKSFC